MKIKTITGLCLMLAFVALPDFSLADGQTCSDVAVADIYVLADSSNSIYPVGYKKELNFICIFARGLPFGPNNVQLATGTFSSTFKHSNDLNTYSDVDKYCEGVLAIPQLRTNTDTAGALDKVRTGNYLFDISQGARDLAKKYLIIITDGKSDDPTATQIAAAKLRNLGVFIIAVGVGNVNITELDGISGKKGSALSVNNFGSIESYKEKIYQRICEAITTTTSTTPEPTTTTTTEPPTTTTEPPTTTTEPPTTTTEPPTTTTEPPTTTTEPPTTTTEPPTTTTEPPTTTTEPPTTTTEPPTTTTEPPTTTTEPPTTTTTTTTTTTSTPAPTVKPCPPSNPVDIVYCVDSSGSIGASNYEFIRQFLKQLTSAFKIGPNDTSIAAFCFGTYSYLAFKLSFDLNYILQSLGSLKYRGSSTGTNYCINDAGALLKKGRPGALKILIVVTDGKSDAPKLTADAATAIKSDGVINFAVGVGKAVDHDELNAIASDSNKVKNAGSYAQLQEIIDALAKGTCDAIAKP